MRKKDIKMFDWIGAKIKGYAKLVCWVGIIGSVILGFVVGNQMPLVGFLVAVVGALLSWVGSFMLYGFGELVDTVMHINDTLNRTDGIGQKKELSNIWYCPSCGQQNTNNSSQCKSCGKFRE